jgi:hypothetical protein
MKVLMVSLLLVLCLPFMGVGQNRSLSFDGTDDIVTATNYKGISGNNPRTVEAWVNGTLSNGSILEWGRNLIGERWAVRFSASGSLRTEISGSGIEGTTVINDGTWHHIAVVLPAGGSQVQDILLYVDGNLETTTNIIPGAPTAAINTASFNDLRIGRAVANPFFIGQIDEVRVWNIGLDQTQIATNMSCGLGGNEAGLELYYNFNDPVDPVDDLTPNNNDGVRSGGGGSNDTPQYVLGGAPISGPCPSAIPTLSQWGLFLFSLLVATLGLIFLYNLQKKLNL